MDEHSEPKSAEKTISMAGSAITIPLQNLINTPFMIAATMNTTTALLMFSYFHGRVLLDTSFMTQYLINFLKFGSPK